MTKKILSGLVLSLFAASAFAQTIVTTTPENKKVILEEFTGIHCVYCPDGHAIAKSIQDANPGNVFLVNVHAGSFANPSSCEPDFRTPFGAALANQSGLVGYPAGTINRHIFPGMTQSGNPDDTAMNRNFWTTAANTTLGEASYLNIAVESEIDVQTNELSIHVEAYYTGSSPEATNKLNVVLLQNDTKGPQTGGNVGNEYNHQHRLVHMITGQWGEDVTTTTAASFVDRNYTYTIPTEFNGVPVELGDLEVVVFMTETQEEIISGNGTFPTLENIVNANDANLRSISEVLDLCLESYGPTVNIQNTGSADLTSVDIEYSINGGAAQTYTWTGTLSSFQNEDVELPATSFTMQATNTIEITLSSDDNAANNNAETTFNQAISSTGTIYMELHTDGYGSEVRWNVTDGNGDVVYNGGPYGNNQTINETFQLDAGCHSFNLIDTYGDGGGAVMLKDSNDIEIFNTNGDYCLGAVQNFSSDGTQVLGVDDLTTQQIVMYPNPASTVLNIRNAASASVVILDVLGKQLIQMDNISLDQEINVASLQTGTYLIKITNGAAVKTEKFIIAR